MKRCEFFQLLYRDSAKNSGEMALHQGIVLADFFLISCNINCLFFLLFQTFYHPNN